MHSSIRNPQIRAFIRFSASLKFAVFNILCIGIMSAYGTIIESQFDATTAQKLVYHSWWSYTIFALFSWNLTAVIIDRIPWRRQHIGFISAHVGILILLGGSLITRYFGIDGSIRIEMGESKEHVLLPNVDLILWGSMDGSSFTRISEPPLEVDFLVHPPTPSKPMDLSTSGHKIEVIEYIPYALRESQIVPSEDPNAGPAVRFQLQNDRVNLSEWLLLPGGSRRESINLGPAQIILSTEKASPTTGNQILLSPLPDGSFHYVVHKQSAPDKDKVGSIKAGETIETGWMGLKFRVLKSHLKAKQQLSYRSVKRPGPLTTSAIKINFDGKEHEVGLNSVIKLFTDDNVFLLQYGNRQMPLNFPIKLEKFNVGRYQGTMRAASYQSLVQYDDESGAKKQTVIAMNEPLKLKGYTFYQASFEQNDMGEPIASILSVNKDPGRIWKYLGCLMIVFGSLYLFYIKKRRKTVKKPSPDDLFSSHANEKKHLGNTNENV